jgi:threonine aldolase
MFSGGAVMRGLPGPDSKLSVESLRDAFRTTRWGDPHHSQPRVLSLTVPTDQGSVYSAREIADLTELAREHGLQVHLDGARLANAIAALGCTPAELTWRAGVDVVSLGALKNGGLSADAIVCFRSPHDPLAQELVYRTKRAGHTASKMRFQSAQLEAYLTDGRWLRWAAQANGAMARLVAGLVGMGAPLVNAPDVNMVFVHTGDELADRLEAAGLLFYRVGDGVIRLVTNFATRAKDIDEVLARWQTCT